MPGPGSSSLRLGNNHRHRHHRFLQTLAPKAPHDEVIGADGDREGIGKVLFRLLLIVKTKVGKGVIDPDAGIGIGIKGQPWTTAPRSNNALDSVLVTRPRFYGALTSLTSE
jgi:hypothetical protein